MDGFNYTVVGDHTSASLDVSNIRLLAEASNLAHVVADCSLVKVVACLRAIASTAIEHLVFTIAFTLVFQALGSGNTHAICIPDQTVLAEAARLAHSRTQDLSRPDQLEVATGLGTGSAAIFELFVFISAYVIGHYLRNCRTFSGCHTLLGHIISDQTLLAEASSFANIRTHNFAGSDQLIVGAGLGTGSATIVVHFIVIGTHIVCRSLHWTFIIWYALLSCFIPDQTVLAEAASLANVKAVELATLEQLII